MTTAKKQTIVGMDDPRLDDYRHMRDREWLVRRGLFLAEGKRLVEAVLAGGFQVRSVLATRAAREALAPLLESSDVPVLELDRALFRELVRVEIHQWCMAAVELGEPLALDDVLSKLGPPPLRIAVLEGVSDPDNIGSVFRNARGLGIDGLVLDPACAHPFYRKALRTSMGAALHVPFAIAEDWAEVVRARGFQIAAFTPRIDAVDLATYAAPERLALAFGGEGFGLSQNTLDVADTALRIPMQANFDSLNVATAAAIAFYELCRASRAP